MPPCRTSSGDGDRDGNGGCRSRTQRHLDLCTSLFCNQHRPFETCFPRRRARHSPAARVWETLNFCRELQAAGVDLGTRGSSRERLGSGGGARRSPGAFWRPRRRLEAPVGRAGGRLETVVAREPYCFTGPI